MKKLGIITIGQSPRTDVVPEMKKYLGDDIEIYESGALDGLTYEQIKEFAPGPEDYVLVSKLRDGRSVKFAEKYILSRLQISIDLLDSRGVDIILFICTGTFPDIFTCNKKILYPQQILHAVVPSLAVHEKVVIVTPEKDQIEQARRKWSEIYQNIEVVHASPYKEVSEMISAIEQIQKIPDASLIVLDCMGYNESMKAMVQKKTGLSVILARTIVARVIGEML